MQRSPRSSSLTGLSSQGALLLALLGAGAAVFLLFVLPRMSASRAAGPASAPPERAAREGTTPVELVQLVPAPDVDPEPEPPAPLPEAATLVSTTAGPEEQKAAAAKVEGPKLKYDREGGSKSEKVDHKDLRAAQREQRKERRDRAAVAAAQGFAPQEGEQESQKAKAAPSPERWRISNRSGTGTGTARAGKGKGKTKGG